MAVSQVDVQLCPVRFFGMRKKLGNITSKSTNTQGFNTRIVGVERPARQLDGRRFVEY